MRVLIVFGYAGGTISLLSGLRDVFLNGWDIPFKDFMLVIICPLMFFTTPWFLHRMNNINAVFAGFIFYGYLLVLANHFNGGGIVSHASFFLVALACLIAVNYGWAGAVFAISWTIVHFVLLVVFRDHFTLVVDFTPPGAIDVWLASGLIFVLLLMSIGAASGQSEMRRAAERLTAARAEAEAASRAKSEFLANMSHEIRTPMNGVLGMAELLKETELTAEQKTFAETIHGSGSALVTIINDILDFSKIEAGKFELDPAPFDLRQALEDVTTLLGVTARGKGIELEVRFQPDTPLHLVGDAGRIRQAVTNLVGNAIKFTHQGSVVIDVSGEWQGAEAALRIAVTDTGIGIAPDKLESVFGQFTQAESSTTRQFGGTGLGLSITRGLIHAMGGAIGVKSEIGKGSTFAIDLTLPVAHASALKSSLTEDRPGPDNTAPVQRARAPDSTKPKILIAEDNEVNRMVMHHMIDRDVFDIAFAEDGKAAYSMARQADYDMIFMDISMPRMDGVEASKAIRAYEHSNGLKETIIVAMTAHAMKGDRERFLGAGMNDYIQKPVAMNSIDKSLQKWLGLESGAEYKAG